MLTGLFYSGGTRFFFFFSEALRGQNAVGDPKMAVGHFVLLTGVRAEPLTGGKPPMPTPGAAAAVLSVILYDILYCCFLLLG